MRSLMVLLMISISAGSPCFAQSEMILVKGGRFQPDEKMKAILVSDLYWTKYKTTIGDWKQFVAEAYPSFKFNGIADYIYGYTDFKYLKDQWPIAGITWLEAVKYCNWVSKKNGREPVYTIKGDQPYSYYYSDKQKNTWPQIEINLKSNGYRLPSWEEWQFAAMGGLDGIKLGWWKDVRKLTLYGFFLENSKMDMQPVGLLLPNSCGLYDMVGLIEEWTNTPGEKEDDESNTWMNSRISAGATINNSYYQRSEVVVNGQLVQPPGTPDYFSERESTLEWTRTYIGLRLVTISP